MCVPIKIILEFFLYQHVLNIVVNLGHVYANVFRPAAPVGTHQINSGLTRSTATLWKIVKNQQINRISLKLHWKQSQVCWIQQWKFHSQIWIWRARNSRRKRTESNAFIDHLSAKFELIIRWIGNEPLLRLRITAQHFDFRWKNEAPRRLIRRL